MGSQENGEKKGEQAGRGPMTTIAETGVGPPPSLAPLGFCTVLPLTIRRASSVPSGRRTREPEARQGVGASWTLEPRTSLENMSAHVFMRVPRVSLTPPCPAKGGSPCLSTSQAQQRDLQGEALDRRLPSAIDDAGPPSNTKYWGPAPVGVGVTNGILLAEATFGGLMLSMDR